MGMMRDMENMEHMEARRRGKSKLCKFYLVAHTVASNNDAIVYIYMMQDLLAIPYT